MNVLIDENTLKSIADSIRDKSDTTDKLLPKDMPQAIENIQSGDDSEYKTFWEGLITPQPKYNGFLANANIINLPTNPPLNTTGCKDFSYFMNNCQKLKTAPKIDTSSAIVLYAFMTGCCSLEDAEIFVPKNCNVGMMFQTCRALTNLTISGVISGNGLNLSSSVLLTVDSLMSVINALESTAEIRTVTLGATNLNKLTDEQKAIATQKGWTLA